VSVFIEMQNLKRSDHGFGCLARITRTASKIYAIFSVSIQALTSSLAPGGSGYLNILPLNK